MERSRLFEAALVIILIGLAGLLFFAVTSPKSPQAMGWEIAGNGSIDYLLAGSGNMLYTFSGNNITAIKPDGSVAWTLVMPQQWRVLNNWNVPISSSKANGGGAWGFWSLPVVDERAGYMYLFVTGRITMDDVERANADENLTFDRPSSLLEITPEGAVAWTYTIPGTVLATSIRGWLKPEFIDMPGIVSVKAAGDRVYLFHDYVEDVLDRDGRLLFTLRNVSAPASVDEQGNIYIVRAIKPDAGALEAMYEDNVTFIGEDILRAMNDPGYMMPSGIVESYSPDGRLLWSRDLGESALRQPLIQGVWQNYNTIPLYVNGTLYVSVKNGAAALDTDGNLLWVRHLAGGTFVPFSIMPADAKGNLYLQNMDSRADFGFVCVIYPDGSTSSEAWEYSRSDYSSGYYQASFPRPLVGKDGIVYCTESYPRITFATFNETVQTKRFGSDTLAAYDVKSNRQVWNFTIPASDVHALVLNEYNMGTALRWSPAETEWQNQMYNSDPGWKAEYAHFLPSIIKNVQVYPGAGVTYVSYDFVMYEYPVIYNISRCIYARGIYALDDSGRLIWEKQPEGFVDKTAAGNGTIYYLTSDGQLRGNTVRIAAGIALAAIAYMFLRFFMLGTVARAKSRLDQNDNRNRVLRYVIEHPGATASDMVKGLGMNMGTLRYHLFILTLNHKVITHQEDDKYLRYFRNAGAYSEAERTMLSLMRREPLRRVLCVLAEKPGLTGSQLAEELNVSATAANRHISLLAEKGVILRSPNDDRGHVYSIKAEYREYLSHASEML